MCGMGDASFNILAIVCYEEDQAKLRNILDFTAAYLLPSPFTRKMISVSARKDISNYFKDFLNKNFNAGIHEEMPLRCYVCKKITNYALEKLEKVPGKLVTADESHLEVCIQFMLGFEEFVHPPKQRRPGKVVLFYQTYLY